MQIGKVEKYEIFTFGLKLLIFLLFGKFEQINLSNPECLKIRKLRTV